MIGVVVASRAEFSTFDSVRKTIILKRFPRLDFYIGKLHVDMLGKLHVKRCWILTWVGFSDFKKIAKNSVFVQS